MIPNPLSAIKLAVIERKVTLLCYRGAIAIKNPFESRANVAFTLSCYAFTQRQNQRQSLHPPPLSLFPPYTCLIFKY